MSNFKVDGDVPMLRQLWACSCGLVRQWGHDFPPDFGPAFLWCLRCGENTRHTFAEVAA